MQIALKSQMAESKQMQQPPLSALPSFTSLRGWVCDVRIISDYVTLSNCGHTVFFLLSLSAPRPTREGSSSGFLTLALHFFSCLQQEDTAVDPTSGGAAQEWPAHHHQPLNGLTAEPWLISPSLPSHFPNIELFCCPSPLLLLPNTTF